MRRISLDPSGHDDRSIMPVASATQAPSCSPSSSIAGCQHWRGSDPRWPGCAHRPGTRRRTPPFLAAGRGEQVRGPGGVGAGQHRRPAGDHPAAAGRALAAAPAPSSAPSRGQWRCYCPRCRPAAGRPAPPRPRPPAGPKRPAAGGIRMSSSRWPPRSVPVLWAMLIVASKSIRRRGVPGRERGGPGSPVELPGSGNLVVWAVPGRQALAEDVGGGARCGQAAPGGPPRHLAPVARNTEATPIHSKPRLASRLSLGIARSSNRESASPMGARQRGRKPRSCSSCLGSLAASLPRSSARQLARL